jgi:hypothetical protein
MWDGFGSDVWVGGQKEEMEWSGDDARTLGESRVFRANRRFTRRLLGFGAGEETLLHFCMI